MRLRVLSPSWTALLLTTWMLIVPAVDGCSPGRGYGRRRTGRRSTPLVLHQHVPNTAETSLAASGPPEGRIDRGSARFHSLVVNDNPDVVFKNDEEGGEARLMSARCRDAVNVLSALVVNQWPELGLRVTAAWLDHHETSTSDDQLHVEGRAVDVTTSDRDRRKLGQLARLAVDAGFDWVYFAARSHVHCSVKSDSSMVARSGGCFPGTSRVRTQDRRLLPLTSVAVGQRVLTFDDSTGSLRYDDVIAFLHRADTGTGNTTFVRISVAGGASITLTKDHLIYASSSASAYDIRPRFAGKVARGDYVFCADDDDDELAVREVVSVDLVYFDGGVYAPLTSSGNVVVDDVITSCYAEVTSHSLAHVAMAPLRVAYWLVRYLHLGRTETSLDSRQSGTYGIHPYASLLRSVAYYFLPELFGNDL